MRVIVNMGLIISIAGMIQANLLVDPGFENEQLTKQSFITPGDTSTWIYAEPSADRGFKIVTQGTNKYMALSAPSGAGNSVLGIGQILNSSSLTGAFEFSFDVSYDTDRANAAYRVVVVGLNLNGTSKTLTGSLIDANALTVMDVVNTTDAMGIFRDADGVADGEILFDKMVSLGSGASSDWTTESGTFTITDAYDYIAVKILAVGFMNSGNTSGKTICFDNVVLVPEPATAGLFILSGIAACLSRKYIRR
ncbi:MAG: PEP-CTERM sorting domain-containing protein [Kiritimatiellales bacterium]